MSRPMDKLQQLMKNLHLSRMAEGLPEELQRAENEGLAYTDLLLRLVRAPVAPPPGDRLGMPHPSGAAPRTLGAGDIPLQGPARRQQVCSCGVIYATTSSERPAASSHLRSQTVACLIACSAEPRLLPLFMHPSMNVGTEESIEHRRCVHQSSTGGGYHNEQVLRPFEKGRDLHLVHPPGAEPM
jgi:hypothetical protein